MLFHTKLKTKKEKGLFYDLFIYGIIISDTISENVLFKERTKKSFKMKNVFQNFSFPKNTTDAQKKKLFIKNSSYNKFCKEEIRFF